MIVRGLACPNESALPAGHRSGSFVLFLPVLLWRLLDEEKVLQRDLPGYPEYMRRVPFRLVPHVW
jgi:protein-S-isoprenylcysteine O-methyltransferase Ste14